MKGSTASFSIYPPVDEPRADGVHVLLHPALPKWALANGTSLHIASLLDNGMSISSAAGLLSSQFDIPLESAQKDVQYVFDSLSAQGFFSSQDGDMPSRIPSLKDVFLHVTDRCNLSCSHCYYDDVSTGDLPPDAVRRMIDEIVDLNGESITFSGGEPLLHRDIKGLLTYASAKLRIQVLSNGTLIDDEWASFLAGLGNVRVQISIDGSGEKIHDSIRGDGAFLKAITAIERLQRAGLGDRITLSATVMKQNIRDLLDIIGLAERLSVPVTRFLPLRKTGRAERQWNDIGKDLCREDYEAFLDAAQKLWESKKTSTHVSCGLSGYLLSIPENISSDNIWCPVGKKLVIAANGDVFPCGLMMTDEFKMGNVFHQTLGTIMESDIMCQTCKTLAERKTTIPECASCPWKNFCQAGCMGQALIEKGTLGDTDGFCGYRKELYAKAFEKLMGDFTSHIENEG